MIEIQQIKLQIPHTKDQIRRKAARILRIRPEEIQAFCILRRSLDARKKPVLFYVYHVQLEVKKEASLRRKIKDKNVRFCEKEAPYQITVQGSESLKHRPVVIGTGPAGLFCGYELARLGYRPVLLERGADVDTRQKDVEKFWQTGQLDKNSNVQFGEGGAGTFSDGKLNTLVHDSSKRNRAVLQLFVDFGAPEQILYDGKPHVGTDILSQVVKNIRKAILQYGGEVWFCHQVTDFNTEKDEEGVQRITSLEVKDLASGEIKKLETDLAVLAIGHSARDTFYRLSERGFEMCAKSFAVGVRVEHPQHFINESQYGAEYDRSLPAAPYKLTAKLSDGRGVYTFCMCPGGYVVNASSEEGRLAVNGMSYSGRDGKNANSAVIVTVDPKDFEGEGALAGIEFQRRLEAHAYREGRGNIPVQQFGDYCKNQPSKEAGSMIPQTKGNFTWANVRSIFPEKLAKDLEEGIFAFDKKLKGYADKDTILAGVESRTSSPVRIIRDDSLQSSIKGVYPCGEGAGYAGGITSAAMDGLKVAEFISRNWRPFDNPVQD